MKLMCSSLRPGRLALGWLCAGVLWFCVLLLPQTAAASTVRVETTLGVIDIALFDTAAPATVANFVNYVQSGAFDSTFFHRSVPGFIIQSGGGGPFDSTPLILPVINQTITAANLVMVTRVTVLPTQTVSLTAGWNLAGNGSDAPLNVATTFADTQRCGHGMPEDQLGTFTRLVWMLAVGF